jgi:hypothetical protein
MGTIHRFEEIEAWQTARKLTKQVYDLGSNGAFARDFGLRDQMQRAAVSIMQEQFQSLRTLCEKCSGQISGFASYLQSLPKQKRPASSSSLAPKPKSSSGATKP